MDLSDNSKLEVIIVATVERPKKVAWGVILREDGTQEDVYVAFNDGYEIIAPSTGPKCFGMRSKHILYENYQLIAIMDEGDGKRRRAIQWAPLHQWAKMILEGQPKKSLKKKILALAGK